MIERLFRVAESGSTVRRELSAGLTTFLSMSYIIFVNPAVLSQAGMDFGAVFTATCLSAAAATFIMGLAANYPIALAPGMGQNFFFLAAVTTMGLSWRQALGAVFVSGLAFVGLTLTRARARLLEAIPDSLKAGIAVGIGLLITLVGMSSAGLVVRPEGGGPARLGDLTSATAALAGIGLLVTAGLSARRVPGALLWGMVTATAGAMGMGLIRFEGIFGPPPSLAPTFLAMDLKSLAAPGVVPVALIFLYMAVFDAIGTLVAVGERAGLLRDGRLIRGERALMADAAGTVAGAALGTSTVTAYVESATGVEAGARTGLANMATGGLFVGSLVLAPLVRMVGGGVADPGGGPPLHPITAPALMLVGALMARALARIPWDDLTEALPAFIVAAGIPFTTSIADGLALGFISYPLIKLLAGRHREVPWIVALLGLVLLVRYLLVS